MKKINWGIIGLGRIANEFAPGFNGLKNATLLGVASKTQEKLIELFDDYNIKLYNDEYFHHCR